MKKFFITLMAVLSLAAFTACSNNDDEAVSETTTASVTEAETTEATEETTEAEAETTAEETTEAETTTEAEKAEVFKGTGYTLAVDSEKWMDVMDYLDVVVGNIEDMDTIKNSGLSAEEIKSMADAMYYYTDNSNANFNMVVSDLNSEIECTDEILNELGNYIVAEYSAATEFNCEGYELVDVGSYRSVKVSLSTNVDVVSADLKLESYFFYVGAKQYNLTFTVPADDYEEVSADFETVLNSISFE